MSEKYKYENGAIHLDHHKELHLGKINSADVKDLMREFFERDAEEVDVDMEEIAQFVCREAEDEDEGPFDPQEVFFVVQADLDFQEQNA